MFWWSVCKYHTIHRVCFTVYINVAVGLRDFVLIYAESIDEHANAVQNADFRKKEKKEKIDSRAHGGLLRYI